MSAGCSSSGVLHLVDSSENYHFFISSRKAVYELCRIRVHERETYISSPCTRALGKILPDKFLFEAILTFTINGDELTYRHSIVMELPVEPRTEITSAVRVGYKGLCIRKAPARNVFLAI